MHDRARRVLRQALERDARLAVIVEERVHGRERERRRVAASIEASIEAADDVFGDV